MRHGTDEGTRSTDVLTEAHSTRCYRIVRRRGIGFAVRDFPRDCLIRLIDFPELPLRINTHDVIKAGRSTLLVRAELPLGDRMTSVAYKRVRPRNWLKALQGMLRPSRAWRTWQLGHVLLDRGISTSRPLAVILPRRHRITGNVYVVTEWINGALNLHAYLLRLQRFDARTSPHTPLPRETKHRPAPGPAVTARLNTVAETLGRLLGHMHAQNVSHRDLKPSNLLLTDPALCRPEHVSDAGNIRDVLQAHVIDLDGAALRSRVPAAMRTRNLARLIVGLDGFTMIRHTVRLRFLKTYFAELGESPLGWKTVWRQLAASSAVLSARKLQKSRRRS